MKLEFGGLDGKVIGTAESQADGTITFDGGNPEAVKDMVRFHVENMVTDRQTDKITADEVLAYVLDRQAAKDNWCREVKPGDKNDPITSKTID